MSSLCIKNASVIVTCDDQDSVLENSSILIEDGVSEASDSRLFPQMKFWMLPDVWFIRDLSTPITTFIRLSAVICLRYRIWNCLNG